ncbi:chemotaxis protein CheW [Candidatus Nitrosotenuis sp. DW1]|uniref:chemotaxis protein CheW n=1 Tax=Candidatus Nitrosotenuis sp. DW1 TaxID=2259672 RepID=UPI0015CD41C1|nr:chemotaxis protein CheW [Candidatus Nitrosotenuis sp. DW1]QLH08196.1 chemotaxis protein CheW [Candidatus Nitrosotenuis sp. DW1]
MMAQTVSDSLQVVSFNIIHSSGKKEDYAVPIEQVREIRAVEKITKVPHSEPHVKGIMNLRGLIIPVIDVKEKLGLDSVNTNSSKQRILVAEVNNSLTGLLVDEVDQVMRIQTKDIEPAPQGALESHNYVKGVAKINEKLMILLDVGLLLPSNKTENTHNSSTFHRESKPLEKPQSVENSIPKNLDDIPPELAAVFKEDEEGIPPTQIIREETT